MRSSFFERREFEMDLYHLTVKGDYAAVASLTGLQPAILSQYFNPAHWRVSLLYKAAAILAGFIERDAARGREMLRRFVGFVERALPEADLSDRGRLLAGVARTEAEIAEVRRLAAAMPVRAVAQALVADRAERRKWAA